MVRGLSSDGKKRFSLFHTHLHRPWGLLFFYNTYRGISPGVKRPRRGICTHLHVTPRLRTSKATPECLSYDTLWNDLYPYLTQTSNVLTRTHVILTQDGDISSVLLEQRSKDALRDVRLNSGWPSPKHNTRITRCRKHAVWLLYCVLWYPWSRQQFLILPRKNKNVSTTS